MATKPSLGFNAMHRFPIFNRNADMIDFIYIRSFRMGFPTFDYLCHSPGSRHAHGGMPRVKNHAEDNNLGQLMKQGVHHDKDVWAIRRLISNPEPFTLFNTLFSLDIYPNLAFIVTL
jgi:hypothetical protein